MKLIIEIKTKDDTSHKLFEVLNNLNSLILDKNSGITDISIRYDEVPEILKLECYFCNKKFIPNQTAHPCSGSNGRMVMYYASKSQWRAM